MGIRAIVQCLVVAIGGFGQLGGAEVAIRTTDGELVIGEVKDAQIEFEVAGKVTKVDWQDLLSFHSAIAPSPHEQEQIDQHFPRLDSEKVPEVELAAATLTEIGLPLATLLLQSFTDDDGAQPGARYRLYRRIVPSEADEFDRTQGLIRLADGTMRRGNLVNSRLVLRTTRSEGTEPAEVVVAGDKIRSLAVERESLTREVELDSRQHVTYIEWLNTGLMVTAESKVTFDATGFVRLSFDEDGWASDPEGIHDPLPGKRRLQQGFRWGSVLGRVGPDGERWFVGKHAERADLPAGRLYLVINENERWQNNIGSFRVVLRAERVFDWGQSY